MKYKFKYNFKSRHYVLVLKNHEKYSLCMTLTHSSKENSIKLINNPNATDSNIAYLQTRNKNKRY